MKWQQKQLRRAQHTSCAAKLDSYLHKIWIPPLWGIFLHSYTTDSTDTAFSVLLRTTLRAVHCSLGLVPPHRGISGGIGRRHPRLTRSEPRDTSATLCATKGQQENTTELIRTNQV